MAQAQETPTFKLVLVGDGGTGKVSSPEGDYPPPSSLAQRSAGNTLSPLPNYPAARMRGIVLTRNFFYLPDHLRQAPCDGRVREEVHGDPRC